MLEGVSPSFLVLALLLLIPLHNTSIKFYEHKKQVKTSSKVRITFESYSSHLITTCPCPFSYSFYFIRFLYRGSFYTSYLIHKDNLHYDQSLHLLRLVFSLLHLHHHYLHELLRLVQLHALRQLQFQLS